MLKKEEILGVKITTNSPAEILEYVLLELSKPRSKRKKLIIFTPNPEQVVAAHYNPQLKTLLNEADIALPDGVGLVNAARMLGVGVSRRIAGVDFMQKLLMETSKRPVKSGFFGSQMGVAEEAAKCLQKSYPKLTIGYASDVYNKEKMIHSDIDILFVGLGFPKQEEWIMAHKNEVPATVFMAVGGSFDFISGKVLRAPKFVQGVGLEWLFRLIRQPWRIRRQARLFDFSALIFAEALSNRFKRSTK